MYVFCITTVEILIQAKIIDLRPNVIKARENTSHTQHKLESVKKRLEAAMKIHSQKQNIIQGPGNPLSNHFHIFLSIVMSKYLRFLNRTCIESGWTELKSQLSELERRRQTFEEQIQSEQSEKNVELKQSQLTQYHKLKEKVDLPIEWSISITLMKSQKLSLVIFFSC